MTIVPFVTFVTFVLSDFVNPPAQRHPKALPSPPYPLLEPTDHIQVDTQPIELGIL